MSNVRNHLLTFCAFFLASISLGTAESCIPTQIRLSFGDLYHEVSQLDDLELPTVKLNNNQAYLVWQSPEHCKYEVKISGKKGNEKQIGESDISRESYSHTVTVGDNSETYQSTAHTALIKGLEYEHLYEYTINNAVNLEEVTGPFKFRLTTPNVTDSPKKIFFVGNTDNTEKGNVTLDRIKTEFKKSSDSYAGLIHLGDVTNKLGDDNGKRGDAFFNSIQDITANLPFILTPGNDDNFDDWKLLNLRIRNPLYDTFHNHYFSFNLQGIHFVSINFEYYDQSSQETQEKLIQWITSDLELANDAQHRALWPWIVVVAHHPIYCAFSDPDCLISQACYNFYEKMASWDELFQKHSVDLMMSGGLHNYERMTPIYKNQSVGQVDQDGLLHSPKATVYINEGVGGSMFHGPQTYTAQGYGVVVNKTQGYGALFAGKSSMGEPTLTYEHYSSENGHVIDSMQIIRSNDQSTGEHHTILMIALAAGCIGLIVAIIVLKKCKFGKVAEDKIPLNPSSPMRSSRLRYNRPGERGLAMVDL